MFYVWIPALTDRVSVTLYRSLQDAIDVAVAFENLGHDVQVFKAAPGGVLYE